MPSRCPIPATTGPWLLARIYEVFPLLCRRCGEPMRLIAFITDSGSITRILTYLGEPAQAPRIAPAACGPPLRTTSTCAKALTRHELLPEVAECSPLSQPTV
jgi:hypothetical protein